MPTWRNKSQVNILPFHLKEREKEQTKPKITRRKEIMMRAETNEIDWKDKRGDQWN